jgi:hypothetical protein
MSFFYQSSAASARSRRGKERDSHHRASSTHTGGRRHRESSKNQDNKSPPSKSPTLQASIYAQQNLALEHLPPLPLSEAPTPAVISPTLKASQTGSNKAGVFHMAHQPYTPAALQKYLQSNPEEDEEDEEEDEEEEEDDEDDEENEESTISESLHLPPKAQSDNLDTQEPEPISPRSFLHEPPIVPIEDSYFPDQSVHSVQSESEIVRPETQALPPSPPIAFETKTPEPVEISPEQTPKQPVIEPEQPIEHDELSKQTTSNSDPGTQVEEFYKYTQPKIGEPLPRPITTTRQRPQSQLISGVDFREMSLPITDRHPPLVRSPSQHTAPIVTRTFTPPAPPLGAIPSQTPPVFMSPKPMRGRVSSEVYMGFHPPPLPPPPNYPPPRHPAAPHEMYHGHPPAPYYMEYAPPSYPPPMPLVTAKLPETPASSISTDNMKFPSHSASDMGMEDDPINLLSRLHTALPQIQMLLSRSQQAANEPHSSWMGHRRMDANHEVMKQKDIRIEQLISEARDMRLRHSEESNRLRSQLGDLEYKYQDLQDEMVWEKQSRDNLELDFHNLKTETATITQRLEDEKSEIIRELEDARERVRQKLDTETHTIKAELNSKSSQLMFLESEIIQLRETHSIDKQSYIQESSKKYTELEESFAAQKKELETKLKNEVERANNSQTQEEKARQEWSRERAQMIEQFNTEREQSRSTYEGKIASMQKDFESQKEAQAITHNAETDKLKKEIETLRAQLENDRTRATRMRDNYREAATRWHQENVCTFHQVT